MRYSYYPGCTLKTKAQALDIYARRCAQVLGAELEELPQWQCCGGVYPQVSDEIATRLSAVRALAAARDLGQDLVTVCSACHHVLKRTNEDLKSDANFREKANRYLSLDAPYRGETRVIHYLELLRDDIGFDKVKAKVVKPLSGRAVGAYYGCMLLRPGKQMGLDDPENPQIIEALLKALGAEPVVYAMRNECCGGYQAMTNPGLATQKATAVVSNAQALGASSLITACPLCQYNLERNVPGQKIPTYYFTELLAEALGVL